MPSYSRRAPAPDTSVRLHLRNAGRASQKDGPSLTVPLSLVFLTLAIGVSFFHAGAVDLRAWHISLIPIGILSVVYWSFQLPVTTPGSRLRQFAPFALPAYVSLQLLPWPAALVLFVSPGGRSIVDALRVIGVPSPFASISVNPGVTFSFLFRIVGYLLIFLLVREFSSRTMRSRPWLTVAPLAVIGLAEALWGLAQKIQGDTAHGGYANKNHFAGLLEMTLPFAVARVLYLSAPDHPDDPGDRFHPRRFLELACFSLLSILLFLALLDSESKMGLVSAVLSLTLVGILWTLSRLRHWHRWFALGCIVVVGAFALVFLPSDELVTRFGKVLTSSQNAGEGRWPIWVDTIHLIRAFPVFGCGLGNYQTAFLKFQTSVIDNTFAFAHNDYLQLFAELGIVGLAILGATVIPLVARPFRVALRYSSPQVRYLALGCAGAITALALHSLADFNLYVPVNAAVLVWILGIAASLTLGPRRVVSPKAPRAFTSRTIFIALGLLLVTYSCAWTAFHSWYQGDVKAEHAFCRFGICDADAAVTTATPVVEVQKLLRRDPASPSRWVELGESLDRSGANATKSFSNATEFGPFVPPILLRVAAFDVSHHRTSDAVTLTARILAKTDTYDRTIFNWYDLHHVPLPNVLQGALIGNEHASQAYFRYLLSAGNLTDAAIAWNWLLSNAYVGEPLAHEYVGVLAGQRDFEEAARAWAAYLGAHRGGYLQSNWVYNGGFESEPTGAMFDWEIQPRDDVSTALDGQVFHDGHHSLRLRFDGKQNLDYQQIRQVAFVSPGTYRFEAYIRTEDITTDEGIGFRIFDPEDPPRLTVVTEAINGSHDWRKVTREIVVKDPTTILEIRIDRKPSLRFDSNIDGTAWIDGVRLAKN